MLGNIKELSVMMKNVDGSGRALHNALPNFTEFRKLSLAAKAYPTQFEPYSSDLEVRKDNIKADFKFILKNSLNNETKKSDFLDALDEINTPEHMVLYLWCNFGFLRHNMQGLPDLELLRTMIEAWS